MPMVINLNGKQLPARGCGSCSGSSSDAKWRSTESPETAPATAPGEPESVPAPVMTDENTPVLSLPTAA